MAVQIWKDCSILFGDQELATTAKSFGLTTDVTPLDKTPLSTTGWVERTGGLKTGRVDLELMTDMGENGPDAASWDNLGSPTVPHTIATASADGSLAYLFNGLPLTHTVLEGSVGDLAMSRLSGAAASSPVVRGKLVHPSSTARTSSGSGTGRQLGAVADGQKLYASLHVIAASGTSPTLDVVVQSDDNAGFTSPTSRITFTQATGTTSQFSSVVGAITDDYWRITYTIGGTTPSFRFGVALGIA